MRGPTPEELAEIDEHLLAESDEVLQGELVESEWDSMADQITSEPVFMAFLADIAGDMEIAYDEALENLSMTPEIMFILGGLDVIKGQTVELFQRAIDMKIGEKQEDA